MDTALEVIGIVLIIVAAGLWEIHLGVLVAGVALLAIGLFREFGC